jgi:hypothetical protein
MLVLFENYGKDLIPLPPSPRREGGKTMYINNIAHLPWERGRGEVKQEERLV